MSLFWLIKKSFVVLGHNVFGIGICLTNITYTSDMFQNNISDTLLSGWWQRSPMIRTRISWQLIMKWFSCAIFLQCSYFTWIIYCHFEVMFLKHVMKHFVSKQAISSDLRRRLDHRLGLSLVVMCLVINHMYKW